MGAHCTTILQFKIVLTFDLRHLGFDHLQLVYEPNEADAGSRQDDWYVMEGVREVAHDGTFLGIEGADGRTTLSVANLDSARQPRMAKTLAGLEGRKVEVRGWIEYRSGPYIAIEDPSQLAVIDESAPPSPVSPAPGGPLLSSERPNGESANDPHKRKRPAHKVPGVDL